MGTYLVAALVPLAFLAGLAPTGGFDGVRSVAELDGDGPDAGVAVPAGTAGRRPSGLS